MCYMFIKQTDANISSLLVMPEYLWLVLALPTKRPWKSKLVACLNGGLARIVRQLLLGKAVRKTSQLWEVVIIPFHIPSPLLWEAGTEEIVL